jgi:hypothetical protein
MQTPVLDFREQHMSPEKWSQQLDMWDKVADDVTVTVPLETQAPLYCAVETDLQGEPFFPSCPG